MRLPNETVREAIRTLRAGSGDAGEALERLVARLQAVDANLCADPECHRHCRLLCGKVAVP